MKSRLRIVFALLICLFTFSFSVQANPIITIQKEDLSIITQESLVIDTGEVTYQNIESNGVNSTSLAEITISSGAKLTVKDALKAHTTKLIINGNLVTDSLDLYQSISELNISGDNSKLTIEKNLLSMGKITAENKASVKIKGDALLTDMASITSSGGALIEVSGTITTENNITASGGKISAKDVIVKGTNVEVSANGDSSTLSFGSLDLSGSGATLSVIGAGTKTSLASISTLTVRKESNGVTVNGEKALLDVSALVLEKGKTVTVTNSGKFEAIAINLYDGSEIILNTSAVALVGYNLPGENTLYKANTIVISDHGSVNGNGILTASGSVDLNGGTIDLKNLDVDSVLTSLTVKSSFNFIDGTVKSYITKETSDAIARSIAVNGNAVLTKGKFVFDIASESGLSVVSVGDSFDIITALTLTAADLTKFDLSYTGSTIMYGKLKLIADSNNLKLSIGKGNLEGIDKSKMTNYQLNIMSNIENLFIQNGSTGLTGELNELVGLIVGLKERGWEEKISSILDGVSGTLHIYTLDMRLNSPWKYAFDHINMTDDKFNVWATPLIEIKELKSNTNMLKYSSIYTGINAGVSKMISDNISLGASLTFGNVVLRQNIMSARAFDISLGGVASVKIKGFSAALYAGYGIQFVNYSRNFNEEYFEIKVSSKYLVHNILASLELKYELDFGLIPVIGFDYQGIIRGEFEEDSNNSASLKVRESFDNIYAGRLGLNYVFNIAGAKCTIGAQYRYSFGDVNTDVTAGFVGDEGTFKTYAEKIGRHSALVNVGFDYPISELLTVSFKYNAEIRKNAMSNAIGLDLQFKF